MKETYEASEYLKLSLDFDKLAKLRSNTSVLATSRASSNKAVVSTNCPFCNEEETLNHFILSCQKYENERAECLNKIGSLIKDFKHLHKKDHLGIILNCHTKRCKAKNLTLIQCTIITFINKIYKIRDSTNV